LENPVFEKQFVVYSSDETEARYILSTSMMERILAFKEKTKTNIQLSFCDSNIYMAVPLKKNFFEPSIRRSVMNFDDVKDYYEQLLFCVAIVDELQLNTRIWTKQ